MMDKQAEIEMMTIEDPFRLDQLEVGSANRSCHKNKPVGAKAVTMHPAGMLLGLATYDINPTTCLDVLVTVRAITKAKVRQKIDKKSTFSQNQTFSRDGKSSSMADQVPVRLVLKEDQDGSRWLPPTDEGIVVKMEADPEPDTSCCCCYRQKRKRDPLTYRSGMSHRLSFYGY